MELLTKEIDDRDNEISELKRKNKTLEGIKNDWIDSQLSERKFPKDYIKQKEELAERKTWYEEQIKEYSEILQKANKKHKEEVDRLEFEIELLRERIPKEENFFTKILGGHKK